MKEARIVRIRTSIFRRQNTVAQFIATRPILDLCEKAIRWPVARVPRLWWEQTGVDWKGAREKAEAAAESVEPGAKALTDSESEADADTRDGTVRVTGEEASLGASGSSGAEWSGVERSGAEWSGVERSGAGRRTNSSNFIGRGSKAGAKRSKL